MDKPREADLYPPVKAHLVALGYEVKGEVGAADIVAMRGGERTGLVIGDVTPGPTELWVTARSRPGGLDVISDFLHASAGGGVAQDVGALVESSAHAAVIPR